MNMLITPHGKLARKHIQNGCQDIAIVPIMGQVGAFHIYASPQILPLLRTLAERFEEWDPDRTLSIGEIKGSKSDIPKFLAYGAFQEIKNLILENIRT